MWCATCFCLYAHGRRARNSCAIPFLSPLQLVGNPSSGYQRWPNRRCRRALRSLPENPASARVLEKVGMRKEGFLVKNLKIHGVWKSSFLYAMLADEMGPASSDSVPDQL